MNAPSSYSYQTSVKSSVSDELINTYVMRPLAGVLVRILYPTPISPNQLTVAAIVLGLVSAGLYLHGGGAATIAAGLFLTAKDIVDSADGQLARVRNQYSRAGRFLDSIGDIFVNASVFAAVSVTLYSQTGMALLPVLGLLGFLGISLRVSYHVFYQTAYLHLDEKYELNRLTEEILDDDVEADRTTLFLQRLFYALYGWQDAIMMRIDRWSRKRNELSREVDKEWYGDRVGLRLSGFLGLGTELFLLTLCSLLTRLDVYLLLNLLMMNGLWVACVGYRRWVLGRRLRKRTLL